jgi:hypothetical protein
MKVRWCWSWLQNYFAPTLSNFLAWVKTPNATQYEAGQVIPRLTCLPISPIAPDFPDIPVFPYIKIFNTHDIAIKWFIRYLCFYTVKSPTLPPASPLCPFNPSPPLLP